MPHQETTYKEGLTRPRWSDWSETGTGKTLPNLCILLDRMALGAVTLRGSDQWQLGVKKAALIVTPPSATVGWCQTFDIVHTLAGIKMFVYAGTPAQRACLREKVDAAQRSGIQPVVLMSWGLLSNKRCEADWRWVVDSLRPHYLVLDEVQYVNNSSSARGQKIQQYMSEGVEYAQCLMLSATPAANGAEKAWDLFLIQHEDIVTGRNKFYHSHFEFIQRHFVTRIDRYGNMRYGKLLNAAYYQKVFAQDSIMHTKDQVWSGRTEPVFLCTRYDMGEEHESLYQTYLELLSQEAAGKGIMVNDHVLALMMRERQLATDPTILGLKDCSQKPKMLEEVLRAHDVGTKYKALVLVEFQHTFARLMRELPAMGLPCRGICGGTSLGDRRSAIEQFSTDPNIRVFVGNRKAMAEGVNLQAANITVNYELGWELDKFVQGNGRTDRHGQKHALIYINFVARRSVDERIWAKIKQRYSIKQEIEREVIRATKVRVDDQTRRMLAAMAASDVQELEKKKEA